MLTTASTVRVLISVTTIIVRTRSNDTAPQLLFICVLSDHFLSGKVRARVRGSEVVGAEQDLKGQGQVQV
jgi:hypothetical protein